MMMKEIKKENERDEEDEHLESPGGRERERYAGREKVKKEGKREAG